MDVKTEFVQKRCGQIIFLSADNFALNCEFCRHDFYTFEALRIHLDEHFPVLQTIIKKEEDNTSCSSISIPAEEADNKNVLSGELQGVSRSDPTVAAVNVSSSTFINNESVKIEQSVVDQQTSKIQTTSKKVNEDILKPNAEDEARSLLRVRAPFSHDKRSGSDGKVSPSKPKRSVPRRVTKRHKCSICDKTFFEAYRLDHHTREKHLSDSDARRYFPCEQCDVKCRTYNQLCFHRQTHRSNFTDFTCDYCEKQFKLKQHLVPHMRYHFGIKPFECLYCHKRFTKGSHKSTHEGICIKSGVINKPKRLAFKFKCKFCPRTLQTQERLNDHENTHNGRRPHECRICAKAFSEYRGLVAHVKIHAAEKPYKCTICERKFASNFQVENHTRETHLPDTDPRRYFPCAICDVKLKSYGQLHSHTQKHRANTERLTCDHCQKQFDCRQSILLHMELHSPIRPTCNYCQQQFRYTKSKRRHTRICTRNPFPKPIQKKKIEFKKIRFECNVCSKSLCSKNSLKNHTNNHTGVRPFHCNICTKTFITSTAFYKHRKEHK